MCNSRLLRLSCGHTAHRYLSYCRGTYASPNTKAPLCSAGPSLTVTIDKKCQNCQYAQFRQGWESRIAEAEAKQAVASQLATGLKDDTAGCSEAEGSWDSVLIGADSLGWGDAEDASKKERKAELEVEKLKTQYRCEEWIHWRSFLGTPPSKPAKKRRSSPKEHGVSPLKNTVDREDIPEEATEEDDLPSLEPSYSEDSDCDLSSEFEVDGDVVASSWSLSDNILDDEDDELTSGWPTELEKTSLEAADPLEEADSMLPSY